MCCGGKCMFLISFRTGSLVFGYIIAVLSALGTLLSTGAIMYFEIALIFGRYWEKDASVPAILISTAVLVEVLSSFTCSVMMLVGLNQNKPALVKPFLIYGMVQVVLLSIFFIMLQIITSFHGSLFVVIFGFLGIYVMCLYMVFQTYQLMRVDGRVFANPPVNPGLLA